MTTAVILATSNPKLAAAVQAALKGHDVALIMHEAAPETSTLPAAEACILFDAAAHGRAWQRVLETAQRSGEPRPIILLMENGDIEAAADAIKAGAADVVAMPPAPARLLAALERGGEELQRRLALRGQVESLREKFNLLTERQKETMQRLVEGLSNKDIGTELGISPRTVEIYRAWVMSKMGARSLAELIRMSIKLGGGDRQ